MPVSASGCLPGASAQQLQHNQRCRIRVLNPVMLCPYEKIRIAACKEWLSGHVRGKPVCQKQRNVFL